MTDRPIPIARLEFGAATNRPAEPAPRLLGEARERAEGMLARLPGLQGRLQAHCERHRAGWVGQESVRLVKRLNQPAQHHPAPRGMVPQRVSPQAIARLARQNVEARITRRLSALVERQQRLVDLVRAPRQMPAQSLRKAMKQEQ